MNRANERVVSSEERLGKLEGTFEVIIQNMARETRRWNVKQRRHGEYNKKL